MFVLLTKLLANVDSFLSISFGRALVARRDDFSDDLEELLKIDVPPCHQPQNKDRSHLRD